MRRDLNRREFVAGAAVAAFSASPAASQAAHAPGNAALTVAQALDAYLGSFAQARDFSGIVLMERAGQAPVTRAFGMANFELDVPLTPDTRFMTASIGKMFTRAAIVALEQAGRLSQGDPLARFLPAYPGAAGISIAQLVGHRAGIARDLDFGADWLGPRSTEELVRMVAAVPPVATPGADYVYSNNGYRLLARVIELAGRGSYDSLVRELVFEPRAMRDTIPAGLLEIVPRRATGYVAGFGWRTLRQALPVHFANYRGAGSFHTTPNDLMRFARTLPLERADLDSASRTNPDGTPKPRSVGHDGLGHGYANLCYAYPDEDARYVMMGNVETGIFGPLHADLRQILFGQAVTPPQLPAAVDVPLDRARASALAGDYDLRPGFPLTVRLAAEGLMLSGGDGFHPLIPLGGDRFFMRLKYATVAFNGGARIESMTWRESGGEFVLRRLG